jgi:predicted amidohydrolase
MSILPLRIALAQINVTVGGLEGKARRILESMRKTQAAGAHVVGTPELELVGYPPEDLLLKPGFVADNLAKLQALIDKSRSMPELTAMIGFVDRDHNSTCDTPVIPPAVIDKPPSAELRPGQRDADSLPPYEVLDPILKAYVENDRTFAEMLAMGFDKATVERVMHLVDISEYKRRQAPPGVRITNRAFDNDRRLPITNRYREGR